MSATSSCTGVFGSRRISLAHDLFNTIRSPKRKQTVIHFDVSLKTATDLRSQPNLWRTVVHFDVQLKTVVHLGVPPPKWLPTSGL